jgi:hypothetical protein
MLPTPPKRNSHLAPKREAELITKFITLMYLMQDVSDDLKSTSILTHEILEHGKIVSKHCETLLETVYELKEVRNSTYLEDLVNKVDTVIRKNYQRIEQ